MCPDLPLSSHVYFFPRAPASVQADLRAAVSARMVASVSELELRWSSAFASLVGCDRDVDLHDFLCRFLNFGIEPGVGFGLYSSMIVEAT